MKKNLFTLILLCSMLFAQLPGFANIKVDTYSSINTIKIHGERHHEALRSPLPAQLSLTDHLLIAESLDFESDFKITITNLSTGEIVYEQIYNASTKYTTIDLGTEEMGQYTIQLSSANWLLYGDFSL